MKKDTILALLQEGKLSTKEISESVPCTLNYVYLTGRKHGFYTYVTPKTQRVEVALAKYRHLSLSGIAAKTGISYSTVRLVAAAQGIKQQVHIRLEPTEKQWRALNMWLGQRKYGEIGATMDTTRQAAQQLVKCAARKLGMQLRRINIMTPASEGSENV